MSARFKVVSFSQVFLPFWQRCPWRPLRHLHVLDLRLWLNAQVPPSWQGLKSLQCVLRRAVQGLYWMVFKLRKANSIHLWNSVFHFAFMERRGYPVWQRKKFLEDEVLLNESFSRRILFCTLMIEMFEFLTNALGNKELVDLYRSNPLIVIRGSLVGQKFKHSYWKWHFQEQWNVQFHHKK